MTTSQSIIVKEVVKGDVNGDKSIDFMDMLLINRHRLGKIQLDGSYLTAADVNEDGDINFVYMLRLNQYRLGKIDSL